MFYSNKNIDTSLWEVHHTIFNKMCLASSLYLKIKCMFSHYESVLPACPKISMDFISVPTLLQEQVVLKVSEGWRRKAGRSWALLPWYTH